MRCRDSALYLSVGALVPVSLAKSFLEFVLLGLCGTARRLRKELLQKLRRGFALFGCAFLSFGGLVANINQGFLPTQAINGCQEFPATFVLFAMGDIHQTLCHANQALGIQFFLGFGVRLHRRKEEVQNRGDGSHAQTSLDLVIAVAAHILLQANQKLAILANIRMRGQNFAHGSMLFGFALQELG